MCTGIDSISAALRAAKEAADFLNSPAAADAEGAACGEVLTELARVRDKLSAAHASYLRKFDAVDAHEAAGYASSAAWLNTRCRMSKRAARASVRQMRVFAARPVLHEAVVNGDLSESWAIDVAQWTRGLPDDMRQETDKIIVTAAAAGADLRDLATIAGLAVETWRRQQPDPERDLFDFKDRWLATGTTFGGAGVIRGDLTPECATALTAVLEALGKRRGSEDDRSVAQRQHDALQEACALLLRARLVPDRAGADTQAVVHVPISQLRQMPGASDLEDEWLRARLGEEGPGYLTGKDAETAACDAQTVPVVTGRADLAVIDKIIAVSLAAAGRGIPEAMSSLTGEAAWALRYSIARLAIDFVSGPGGIASTLRTGLLAPPYTTPSLPLDIGWADSIPPAIRRAVLLRDRHCAWPGCRRRPVYCDVHHIQHKKDGGETSVRSCVLLCGFHHDVCIHRRGWQIILHPDGTTEARSPDGTQVLRSHAPPLVDPA